MNLSQNVIDRNAAFAADRFAPELRIVPALKTIVVGCVDPRVDPATVLGTAPGEIAAIRNVGGRVTKGVLDEVAMLRKVTQAAGGELGPGWELLVLHHTDCGITRLVNQPAMLARFFGIAESELDLSTLTDPWSSAAHDVALLATDERLPGIHVAGYVYDVATGHIDAVAST